MTSDKPEPYVPKEGDEVVVVLEDWAKSHYRGRFVRVEPAPVEQPETTRDETCDPDVPRPA
jgi:hypothetical protein